MAPQDILLRNICGKTETYDEARRILPIARTKTRPGSGYELGQGATGLTAICAYIASQRLGNGDVSQTTAQASSCLNPKIFANTLKLVRTALAESESVSEGHTLTYEKLLGEYRIPHVETVTRWLEEVEVALWEHDKRWKNAIESVKCAVFYWTCMILNIDRVEEKPLRVRHDVPAKTFNAISKVLDQICDPLAARISGEVAQLRTESKRKKATSPSKRSSPSKSPSKSALVDPSQTASPSKDVAQKRKVAFLQEVNETESEDMFVPETPTKRRKIDSPMKLASTSPVKAQPITSSSRQTLNGSSLPTTPRRSQRIAQPLPLPIAVDVNSSDEEPVKLASRRFRPVFLDQKQWSRRDARVAKVWEAAEEHMRKMVELYGHPLDNVMIDGGD